MAKLGYTWYPKDWGNSESVFELNLSERGLYREIIDLAMLNDNKTELKKDVWCRKFGCDLKELEFILQKLIDLGCIKITKTIVFVPSCESRLNLVRGGRSGGKNKPTPKPADKPIDKPFASLEENKDKPMSNQIETKIEIETKTKNDYFFDDLIISESWLENTAMQSTKKFNPAQVKDFLKKYNDQINVQFDFKQNKTEYCTHFVYWLNKQEKPKSNNNRGNDAQVII